jgi:hypothetical protein
MSIRNASSILQVDGEICVYLYIERMTFHSFQPSSQKEDDDSGIILRHIRYPSIECSQLALRYFACEDLTELSPRQQQFHKTMTGL